MSYRFYQEDRGYVFIHIPKTGGTSLEELLNNSPGITNDDQTLTGHINARDTISLIENPSNYTIFSFVRNPWSWYVSWYFYICKTRGIDSDFYLEYDNLNSFSDFLNYVFQNESRLVFEDYGNRKFAQFTEWLELKDQKLIENIFKIEDIAKNQYLLKEKIGLDICFDRKSNSTEHKRYVEYYNDSMVDMVAEMHRGDIKRFKYSFGE